MWFLFFLLSQVTDHLKAAANGIDVRVVPIVGGMSTEKQERLLRKRPEIVVGTPGRLWELISGGEKHLVEVVHIHFCVFPFSFSTNFNKFISYFLISNKF